MEANELWMEFAKKYNIGDCKYSTWSFDIEPDILAQLVLNGEKTATSSPYPLYEIENETLPKQEDYSIILDSNNNAVCIIKTKKVSIVSFSDVTLQHAYKEGEEDKSLKYWRETHQKFFTKCLKEVGIAFTKDMLVVCEEFEVVYS